MPVPRTLTVTLPDLPEWADHAIQGKATVPAVLLLDLLVRSATERDDNAVLPSTTSPLVMRDAIFPRFLPADEVERCTFEMTLEHVQGEATDTRATLTSRIALGGGISRTRTHASVTLGGSATVLPAPHIVGDFELSADRAYTELIPFGPRYRNLRGAIQLGQYGGTAWLCSPEPAFPYPSRAGCPYLFDSAMHLACLWGQRYAGVVTYPTGFTARVLAWPLAHGRRRCTVAPRAIKPPELTFDLWLTDEDQRVCDAIVGLAMTPLVRGPQPPAWIVHSQATLGTP
jgi:hypothetical protein